MFFSGAAVPLAVMIINMAYVFARCCRNKIYYYNAMMMMMMMTTVIINNNIIIIPTDSVFYYQKLSPLLDVTNILRHFAHCSSFRGNESPKCGLDCRSKSLFWRALVSKWNSI